MGSRHDSVRRAFDTPEWRSSAEAFFQTRGLSLFVMDLAAAETLFSADRCGYCHLSLDAVTPSPLECYDRPPRPRPTVCQQVCRAGLATYQAPITHDGQVVAHAVVSGFVSSTRERRKLYEHLIGRGVREEAARLAVRGMPVVTRREIEGFARLAASTAQAVIAANAAPVATTASPSPEDDARRDADTLMDAGIEVAGVLGDAVRMPQQLLASALTMFGADAGTIALARPGGYVEMVASAGEGVRALGMKLRLEGGAAARALESGRTVVVASDRTEGDARRRCTIVAPVVRDTTPVGTLELRVAPGRVPSNGEVRRIERFARFAALTIENAEQRAATERALADMERANMLGATLDRLTDGGEIISAVLEELCRSFMFDVAGVVLTSWGRDRAEVVLVGDATADEIMMLTGEAAGRDLAADPLDALKHRERGGTLIQSGPVREHWAFISTALASGDHLAGYLFCASASGNRFTGADNRLLEAVSEHAAAAIERAALFSRIRDDFARTIAALSSSLDSRQNVSQGHSARVMEYALLIGETLHLPAEQLEILRFAGLLHDIGASGVTEQILLSPVNLPEEELLRVRMQAELGASVVEQIEFLKDITPVVLHHHELWDGSGYPMGLAGESIPLLARVLAVADAFETMTDSASGRRRRSFANARKELRTAAGSKYDPRVVAALLDALDSQALAGSTGLLVAQESKGRPELPA